MMANHVAIHEKGFTVLYEASHPKIDVVFIHGFTGHPEDTWVWKGAKGHSKKCPKKHRQDEEPIEAVRRSKIPRLPSFGGSRRTPWTAESSSAQSSQILVTGDKTSKAPVEAEGQWRRDVYWPADLACKTLPNSRILTYGYDTKVRHWAVGQVSRKTVYDHAWDLLCSLEALRRAPEEKDRSVLFIAHSLGGLVIKEALRRSRDCITTKPHLHNIFEATAGILFFGTPHRGADPRNFFHHVLTASVQVIGFQVNNQIVNTLMPEAERLSELRDEFSVMCHQRKWQVYSFQEEYGITALFGTQVVDDTSSCLNDPTIETKQHISNNHMNMCRFSGFEDPEYLKVAAAMTFILGTIENGMNAVTRAPSIAHRQFQDISPSPETQNEPVTRASHNIVAINKQSLVDQLYFAQIDERLTSLAAAQGTTCRWFLSKPEYTSWHDAAQQPDYGGFLWIKGNPGTGKSTLMKLLFEEAKLNTRGDSSQITLSFFFLARGTVEEKSTMGLYRSLLHQLFEKAVELRDSLEWMTADGARLIQRNGWNEEALKQTLMRAVQGLGSRPLMIFVDALDECDKSQARGMICFFEELCDRAIEAQVRLQICFSSRHYPTVVIQKGIEVILEDEIGHIEDIKQYIKSKLRLGKSKQAEFLRSEILEKSSYIFLWVVLVLDILNSEYPDSSISIKKIRERLKEIPPKLNDLFEVILTRDEENLERLQICLNLILFAARPLKPQELYFAVQLGLDKECSSCWDQEDVELEDMKTFVRSSSKGLAEVTRNKATDVQFIHESVRDFLLGKYGGQWSGLSGNFAGHAHEILRDCCVTQLNAPISQDVDIPDPLPPASKAAQLRKSLCLKFPFLEYSVLNILYHANNAQQNAIEQGSFLTDFPLQQWIYLNNILERYDIRRYTESVSLLYILAEKNLADLIRIHPQRHCCFDIEDERYGLPLFAALATGSHEVVQTFIEAQAKIMPQNPSLHHLCIQYSKNRNTSFSRSFNFSPSKSISSHVAEQGDEVILTFLCASGKLDVESENIPGWTPLSYAAAKGHEAVVKLLLEKGAEQETKDKTNGKMPLLWATKNGHDVVVRLLLEKGAELEIKDKTFGQTPLSWAAEKGHEAVVRLLLEKDAELETKSTSSDKTPLSWAAMKGREAVVKLLLEKGAELETVDNNGETPLSSAAWNGHEVIARLLLKKGAKLETMDNNGRTPLSYATQNGHEVIVRLLLEKGAELENVDNNSRTPLSYAAQNGHEVIARLLLKKGAKLETKDNYIGTPLSHAAENGYEAVVKLLLEKGAELETVGNDGRTPLLWAARRGHERVVRLLLGKGARLETKGNDGQTPLLWAVRNGYEAIVRLLLEKGAELEAVDNDMMTPLPYAIKYKREAIVRLLLEKGAELETQDKYGRTPLLWAA